jgi:DNA-binding transcriptional ArsR family regulator
MPMYRKGMKKTVSKSKVLESGPLETLFSGNATAKIMDFIISSQEWDYSESDIARNSDVSIRTVQRELSKLLESKLIKQVRTVGNAKMYQLDKSYRTGYVLEKLALSLAQQNIRKMTKADVKTNIEELEKIPLVEEVLVSSDIESEPSDDLEELVA